MNRDIEPADLLPAIQTVGGALVANLVLAEAARSAAERELAELRSPMDGPAENVVAEPMDAECQNPGHEHRWMHGPACYAGNGQHTAAKASGTAPGGPGAP